MKLMKNRSGVTLIEILLSIIVLSIGILGVLALFPSAIATNNATAQDVMAANLAASVEQALMVGMSDAYWNSTYQTYQISLSHDLQYINTATNTVYNSGLYQFLLPTITYNAGLSSGLNAFLLPSFVSGYILWHRHPAIAVSPLPYPSGRIVGNITSTDNYRTPINPQNSPAFNLLGDSWVSSTITGVQNATMGYAEPYEQYQFSFDVIKLDRFNASWMGAADTSNSYTLFTTPGTLITAEEYANKFYEFRIHIFRGAISGGSLTSGSGTQAATTGTAYKVRILTVPLKIAVNMLH